MMRTGWMAAVMGIGAAASLAAATGASDLKDAIGPGEGFVDILTWPGYIERGESDPKYDWVTGFEKKTGCQVRIKTAGTFRATRRCA